MNRLFAAAQFLTACLILMTLAGIAGLAVRLFLWSAGLGG